MIKFAVLFTVLFVSARAFPFLNGYNNPHNLDTPDDDQQGGQQGGQVNVAGQNERGDTADDDGQGVAGQAVTNEPEVDSSSSSSSEEVSDAPDTPDGTDAPPAGPIVGNQPGAGGQQAPRTGTGAGGSSNDNFIAAVGGPNYAPQAGGAAPQGGSSQGNNAVADPGTGAANSLTFGKSQAAKESEARRSGAVIGATTLILVAGVATVSVFAYKYKDAITARVGL